MDIENVDVDAYREIMDQLSDRAKKALEYILEHGSISTYEIRTELEPATGGTFDDAPRVAQDLKDSGIPLESGRTKHPKTGSRIAVYSLKRERPVTEDSFSGRSQPPKWFRNELIDEYGERCNISSFETSSRHLQMDHRIPYQVAGNPDGLSVEEWQLLSPSVQRKKSFSCERCGNFNELQDPTICRDCYWAYPEDYDHVAMTPVRRVDLVWAGEETENYEKLKDLAASQGRDISEIIKASVREYLSTA